MLQRPPSRQRRYRERRRRHEIIAPVVVDADIIDLLVVKTYWLREENAGDRYKIAEAIARMLKDAVESDASNIAPWQLHSL